MSMIRWMRLAAATLVVAAVPGAASAGDDAWERANAEYDAQRFANALAMYEEIASTGDARAAELAGHMLVLGETLFGESVRRDPERAAKLLAQAAEAGRPVAVHLLRRANLASATPVANR